MNTASIQLVLEHISIFFAAITGVLAARGKQVDLFGVVVLALVTAFGGGTLRDVLAGDLPPVWLRTSPFLINGALTALAAFFLARLRNVSPRILLVADAFALALFTMIGTRKGLALEFKPSVCVLFGVVTGVAGGIVRDVLVGQVPMVFRREIQLYATASLLGAAFYVVLAGQNVRESIAILCGAGLVLLLRLTAIRWNLSLPILESR